MIFFGWRALGGESGVKSLEWRACVVEPVVESLKKNNFLVGYHGCRAWGGGPKVKNLEWRALGGEPGL